MPAPDQGPAKTPSTGDQKPRVVTARSPHRLWHADITVVPRAFGLWVPWLPFSLPIVWPFSWHVLVVLDHYSRAVVAIAAFTKAPATADIVAVFERAAKNVGKKPRYIVTDQGPQFWDEYCDWCDANGILPRFGAIG